MKKTLWAGAIGLTLCAALLLASPSVEAESGTPRTVPKTEADLSDISLSDYLPQINSPEAPPDAPEKKEDKTPEKLKKVEKEKTSAPYKVYATPRVLDDAAGAAGEADPYALQPKASSLSPRDQDVQALTAILQQSLGQQEGGTAPEGLSHSYPVSATSSLPSQFFPILPLGALPDTPPSFLPLATNMPLEGDHSSIVRAIIFIHDMTRNASDGLAMMTTLAGSTNGTTMILTPQYPLALDIARFAAQLPGAGEKIARWPLGRDVAGWESGGDSVAGPRQRGISSFTALDLILLYLGDHEAFPSLRQIVIAGHGMGADFIQRYAALSQATDVLSGEGLDVRFIVANASSYLYLTNQRPDPAAPQSFAIAKADACPEINFYPYGLKNLVPYGKRIGATTIKMRYANRHILYLVGKKILSDAYLDRTCPAEAEGKDRLTRAYNFERYLMRSFGDRAAEMQTFAAVPDAGYDAVSLFGSYCGLSMLFGDGTCQTRK